MIVRLGHGVGAGVRASSGLLLALLVNMKIRCHPVQGLGSRRGVALATEEIAEHASAFRQYGGHVRYICDIAISSGHVWRFISDCVCLLTP